MRDNPCILDVNHPEVVVAVRPASIEDMCGDQPYLAGTVNLVKDMDRAWPWTRFLLDSDKLKDPSLCAFLLREARMGSIHPDRVYVAVHDPQTHIDAWRAGIGGIIVSPDVERVSDAREYLRGIQAVQMALALAYGRQCLHGRPTLPVLLEQKNDDPYGFAVLKDFYVEGLIDGCLDSTPHGVISSRASAKPGCGPRILRQSLTNQGNLLEAWRQGTLPVIPWGAKSLYNAAVAGDALVREESVH